jgi:anti-sigma regulatory factor (Ser/Thr protein kinase)
MMTELSLNILDVAGNSVRAKASLIEISVIIDRQKDTLTIQISDNGCGMDDEQLKRASDPFFTTRTVRNVGLGLPFMKQAAEGTGGSFEIDSEPGKGTIVTAVFGLSHIDRMPLGDMTETIYVLITANPDIDFIYTYKLDEACFSLDTRELRNILGDVPLNTGEVASFLKDYLQENQSYVSGSYIV